MLPHFQDQSSFTARSNSRELLTYGTGTPHLQNSFCAALDILGFKESIRGASESSSSKRLLHQFSNALIQSSDCIDKSKLEDAVWCHKSFTDNLVIGYLMPELHVNIEAELAQMIHIVATHQLVMALNGFAVRGSLTAGELYVGRDLVYGEALIRANDLDKSGSPPRTIISDECANIIRAEREFDYAVMEDTDGSLFVNYLTWLYLDDYVPELGNNVLFGHKRFIERGLLNDRKVRSKYIWLAQYHNFFCKNTNDPFDSGHLSDLDALLIPDIQDTQFKSLNS